MSRKNAKRKPLPKKPVDPIHALIAEHKRLVTAWSHMYDVADRAEWRAKKKHGNRPWSLIAWRCYSAIGGREIEGARERFLQEKVAPRKVIQKEYLDAKARERAGERAEIAWDRRAGMMPLRRKLEQAFKAERGAALRMVKTRPTTPAGAAALLAYTKDDAKGGEINWHGIAMDTLIQTLKAWGRAVPS